MERSREWAKPREGDGSFIPLSKAADTCQNTVNHFPFSVGQSFLLGDRKLKDTHKRPANNNEG
jgi:hypothetical protein